MAGVGELSWLLGGSRGEDLACLSETAAPESSQTPQAAAAPAAESQLGGGGSPRGPPGPISEEDVSQILSEFQTVELGERGGHGGDDSDLGINTREAMEHVRQSEAGTTGQPITLLANFCTLTCQPQWVLYQYHVDFKPQMESVHLRRALLDEHEETLGPAHVFEGDMLFLAQRLHSEETVLASETRKGEMVVITVTLTNQLPPTSPVCLQFYDLILRRIMRFLNMQQFGHHYYNTDAPLEINRLTVWTGFSTSICAYDAGIMLCIDMSHKVLRSGTVLDLMMNLRQRCEEQHFMEICAKEIVGLTVLTKYNKTYKIDGIAWDHTPCNMFRKGDTDVSFKDYLKNQYDQDVTDDSQALLISRKEVKSLPPGVPQGEPALLVPELCLITGLTDKMRADFNLMKDLSAFCRLCPEQKNNCLQQFITDIGTNPDSQAEMAKWGLIFDKQLLRLKGRVLQPERLRQGDRQFGYNPHTAEWTKEMRGLPLTYAPPLNNWLLLYTRQDIIEAQALLQSLYRVSGPLGIRMQRPVMMEYEDHQESLMKALWCNVTPEVQMVVVVLPTSRKDWFSIVKKYLCVECPTPSQCVLARTLCRPHTLMTIANKIALQLACKMGGELWSVEIPLRQLMVVGIDCCHDQGPGRRFVVAMVASLNQSMSRWFSRCVLQSRGQEINQLKTMFSAALKEYLQFNGSLPSHIVVYRDGVGDDQLRSVVFHEVSQILDSIASLGDYTPKLSVVVVKKLSLTRFFLNGKSNPPPGTVVDSAVTRPERSDFYLVSQATRDGCVCPTNYNVVYNTSGLEPDHIQRLTYKLCHVYYNFQGVIKVPAPCKYAHKLASLVAHTLHKPPHVRLNNLLFFL